MAERRMFAKTIIDSDNFLDMPLSTQALYFHLSMRADDEGFVNNPRKVQRMIGAADDDMRVLTARRFIIVFESGVIVIKHWKLHNYIQKDRFKATVYQEEKSMLQIKENGVYTECIQDGYDLDTQVRLGKDRLGKDIDTVSIDTVSSSEIEEPSVQDLVDAWNSLAKVGIKPVLKLASGTKRYDNLKARIRQYGEENVLQAISNIRNSKFLQGHNDRAWVITFDWFVKPNNFVKVLEGNYQDKQVKTGGRLDWIDGIDFSAVEDFS